MGGTQLIPETLTTGRGMNFFIHFETPDLGYSSTVDLQFDYVVLKKGQALSPLPSLTDSFTTTIDATTHPGRNAKSRVAFFIPHSDLIGAEGGQIAFALYRRADTDGNADDFDLVSKGTYYGSEIKA